MVTINSTIAMRAVRGEQMNQQLPVTRVVELTECCERLEDWSVLQLPRAVAGISGIHDNTDELNKRLKLVFRRLRGESKATRLEDKVDKSPCTA